MIRQKIISLIISLPGLLVAMVFHEVAHGYVSYRLGDNTAKESGRLTLNPIKHIDPIGFLFLIIFKFGWAKPVPINPSCYKNRKKGTILVSLAGPFTNFIIALITALFLSTNIVKNQILLRILIMLMCYNLMLGIFNLLPFPPLDGSKILASLLPIKYEILFYKYERYLNLILIFLIITNAIDKVLGPSIDFGLNILLNIISQGV